MGPVSGNQAHATTSAIPAPPRPRRLGAAATLAFVVRGRCFPCVWAPSGADASCGAVIRVRSSAKDPTPVVPVLREDDRGEPLSPPLYVRCGVQHYLEASLRVRGWRKHTGPTCAIEQRPTAQRLDRDPSSRTRVSAQ